MKVCDKNQKHGVKDIWTKDLRKKAGGYWRCRKCVQIAQEKYRQANREKRREACTVWRKKNPNYSKQYYTENTEYYRKYREENEEAVKKVKSDWVKNNYEKVAAAVKKRKLLKINRTPNWLTEDQLKEIENFYKLAQMTTLFSGIQHEVDHVIPLQGDIVSGLHHPDNLQVITQSENRSKSNKF